VSASWRALGGVRLIGAERGDVPAAERPGAEQADVAAEVEYAQWSLQSPRGRRGRFVASAVVDLGQDVKVACAVPHSDARVGGAEPVAADRTSARLADHESSGGMKRAGRALGLKQSAQSDVSASPRIRPIPNRFVRRPAQQLDGRAGLQMSCLQGL
jgi:hypothetical protein